MRDFLQRLFTMKQTNGIFHSEQPIFRYQRCIVVETRLGAEFLVQFKVITVIQNNVK